MDNTNEQAVESEQQQPTAQTNPSETNELSELDKVNQEKEQALADKEKAEREVEFYKGFTALTSKYSAAGDFQDKIKEKVMAGYDVEDATIAVLTKEGKLNTQTPAPVTPIKRVSPVGGSATTTLRSNEKSLKEMNRGELREELIKMEQESGAISTYLNRTL